MQAMQAMLISISGAVFIYSILRLLMPVTEKEAVKVRISKYFSGFSIDDVEDQVMKERFERSQKKKLGNIKFVSRELSEYVSSTGIKLTASEFLIAWIGAAFAPMAILALLKVNIITIIGIVIIGLVIPPLLLKRSRKKRQEIFTKQLGEALVIMGNAIKGGFSFRQAMESITVDMQPPISSEFGKTLREIHYGVTMDESLQHMTERVKNQDLDLLISAIITSSQVGGNLSDILDTISSTIKDRIRIKQEVRVLTSSARISSYIIGLLPIIIVLALMIMNPDYFGSFFKTDIGKLMLVISVILEATGFLFIKKIADIQY